MYENGQYRNGYGYTEPHSMAVQGQGQGYGMNMQGNSPMVQGQMMQQAQGGPHIKDLCKQYSMHFVQLQMTDGTTQEGIIINQDDDTITLLMPEEDQREQAHQGDMRQPWYGGGPGYGYGYGYGVPRRFRRFYRRTLPYYLIGSLLFPYFY
ncbi:hypothetical protein FLK61_33515 [Paenalkalicoccus suaedae]|uniref:Uncharacterized protein n=1 Tax=Paenalkalicoccus suaedae TaxID=2592382 RepID=A0A859FEU4_9BACI|nr:hypothetical protein [Paenalkalicoccus suaedae]QKS71607.1 hypothetical protein FLK61_33515 [Paenalkalicoccus suaedae]